MTLLFRRTWAWFAVPRPGGEVSDPFSPCGDCQHEPHTNSARQGWDLCFCSQHVPLLNSTSGICCVFF